MRGPELLLVRHGESTWNAEGRWQGQGDPPLSLRGRAQAMALARRLGDAGVTTIVTSDLARARETAAILAQALGLRLRLEPRLRELDVGCWSGLSMEEIARGWPEDLARFRAGDLDLEPGGGESRRRLRARVRAALDALLVSPPGPRIAVVTHLGVVQQLLPEVHLACAEWRRVEAVALPDCLG